MSKEETLEKLCKAISGIKKNKDRIKFAEMCIEKIHKTLGIVSVLVDGPARMTVTETQVRVKKVAQKE